MSFSLGAGLLNKLIGKECSHSQRCIVNFRLLKLNQLPLDSKDIIREWGCARKSENKSTEYLALLTSHEFI